MKEKLPEKKRLLIKKRISSLDTCLIPRRDAGHTVRELTYTCPATFTCHCTGNCGPTFTCPDCRKR